MIEQIRTDLHQAERKNQKIAMFHYQVLIHADELEGIDPVNLCKELSVPKTYATEFRKMIALARLMRAQDARLARC